VFCVQTSKNTRVTTHIPVTHCHNVNLCRYWMRKTQPTAVKSGCNFSHSLLCCPPMGSHYPMVLSVRPSVRLSVTFRSISSEWKLVEITFFHYTHYCHLCNACCIFENFVETSNYREAEKSYYAMLMLVSLHRCPAERSQSVHSV